MKTFIISSALALAIFLNVSGQNTKKPSAFETINLIINRTGAPVIPNTVDIIKEGDPETHVTGIVTTMFATMPVLKEAVAKKCNLIIVHEPLYYNHADETKRFAADPVFLEKQKFIRDNKLVIWRFHDYIHSMKPDGITTGMIERLGWKKYLVNGKPDRFILPETTLENLLKELKKIFPNNTFYVVGKPEMKIKNVCFDPGAPGSATHINQLEDPGVDLVIGGEAQQWETYEYTRDAVDQGRKKAVIFLGHIPSEEAGMEYCSEWLQGFIKNIPVYFIKSGSSFWSY
jgi:putative NIF3 family GTP cyclohydrolase 1 type 2